MRFLSIPKCLASQSLDLSFAYFLEYLDTSSFNEVFLYVVVFQ